MSDSKMEQLRQSFVKIIRHKQDIELEVIKLLKNPAATGAQIMEARQAMLGVEEPLGRAVRKLRERYPYHGFTSDVTRPWHKPEYDRYETTVDKTSGDDRTGRATETIFEKE
jgi:hypothetical protein